MSGFSKVLVSGPVAQVSIEEAGGELKLKISIGADAGGGNLAGFAKVAGSIEADLEAKVLVDAGLALAKAKFPAAAAAIDMAQGLIDAELAKI